MPKLNVLLCVLRKRYFAVIVTKYDLIRHIKMELNILTDIMGKLFKSGIY